MSSEPGRSSSETSPTIPSSATPKAVRPAGFTVAVTHCSGHNGEWQDVSRRLHPLHGMALGRREREPHLKKDMRVFVAGRLVQRSWQDNDGNKRQTVEIQVTT